jgi:diguanylate cyclase (GGDEF)-like protein
MSIDSSNYISIHIDSIAVFLTAVVLFFFFLFGLYYYYVVRKYRVLIAFAVFQLALFINITGHGLLLSSTNTEYISLWTRISFTGYVFIPLTFYYFIESITEKRYKTWKKALFFITPMFLGFLWIKNTMVLTDAILIANGQPALVKGEFFLLLVLLVVLSVLVNFVVLVRKFLHDATFRDHVWPLLIGVSIWIVTILLDMVLTGIMKSTGPQLWIGPLLMSAMVVVYLANNSDRMQQTIRKVLNEKSEVFTNSNRDNLTGVFNSEYLEKALTNKIESYDANSDLHCLLFLDIDNLKLINDKMGRRVGDMLLQILGRIIQNYCRRSDIPARFGGDEFVLLLFNCTENDAVANAKQIKSYFQKACLKSIPEEYAEEIGLSIGLSTSGISGGNLHNMVQLADLAMYYAKRKTRDSIGVYRVESKFKQEYIELV